MIREKREGWTAERTMDPLRPSMSGGGGLESHKEQKEMGRMKVALFKGSEDEPSVGLMCKHAASLAC